MHLEEYGAWVKFPKQIYVPLAEITINYFIINEPFPLGSIQFIKHGKIQRYEDWPEHLHKIIKEYKRILVNQCI